MSHEAPKLPEGLEETPGKGLDDTSFVDLAEGQLYPAIEQSNPQIETPEAREAAIGAVRERLNRHVEATLESSVPLAESKKETPRTPNQEALQRERARSFIDSIAHHPDEQTTREWRDDLLTKMSPVAAANEALEIAKTEDADSRHHVFYRAAVIGTSIGAIGMVGAIADSLLGGSLLGASGAALESSAIIGGAGVIIAGLATSGLIRGGMTLWHRAKASQRNAKFEKVFGYPVR